MCKNWLNWVLSGSGPAAPGGGVVVSLPEHRQFAQIYGFIRLLRPAFQIADHEVDDRDYVLNGPEVVSAGLRALNQRIDSFARSIR